jgi:hypothetical protein
MSNWDDYRNAQDAIDLARQIEREGGFEQFKRNREVIARFADRGPQNVNETVRSIERARALDIKDLAERRGLIKAEDIRQLFELTHARVRIPEEWLNLKKTLDDYARVFGGQVREIERTMQPYRDLALRLHTEGQRWAESIRSITDQLATARGTLAIESSSAWRLTTSTLTERLREVNMFASRPQLASRLMQPTFAYSEFASRTLERLESPTNERDAGALAGSLTLADEQIVEATSALEAMIEVPNEADRASPQVPYNVFDEQLQDLVLAGEVSTDSSYEYLSLRSPAAAIAGKVRQILALVNRCNAAVKLRGDQPAIFKAPYMVMEAYTDLPWLLADGKGNFTIFINYLYSILYEGAGSQNLRFIAGNYISQNECEPLWNLKYCATNGWTMISSMAASRASVGHGPSLARRSDILAFKTCHSRLRIFFDCNRTFWTELCRS